MSATQTSSKDSNSWQESKYPRTSQKPLANYVGLTTVPAATKEPRERSPSKTLNITKVKRLKLNLISKLWPPAPEKLTRFAKTQQKWKNHEWRELSGEGLRHPWQSQDQKSLLLRNKKELSLKRHETENEENEQSQGPHNRRLSSLQISSKSTQRTQERALL